MLSTLYFVVPLIFATSVILGLVATGALYSERSGVVNIALEGIMIMGGFIGAIVIRSLEQNTGLPLQIIALIGLFAALVSGLLFSLLHAFASINMKANQIISATALNIFAPAIAIFVARATSQPSSRRIIIQESYLIRRVPILGDIPFIGDLFFTNAYLSTYIGIGIFAIAVFVLYKTPLGLRIRSCGENPHAADSLGVNIYKIRYIGVMVSGALAGMGGMMFILSFAAYFNATVAGFGFLALAVLIFGQWKPKRIVFAAFFFGTMRVLSATILQDLDIGIPNDMYFILPFLVTLIALSVSSKKSQGPKAAGQPYDPSLR